jgi:hypothetical protein
MINLGPKEERPKLEIDIEHLLKQYIEVIYICGSDFEEDATYEVILKEDLKDLAKDITELVYKQML